MSWDETAVLYAVRGLSFQGIQYWSLRSGGCNVVDPKNGSNKWAEAPDRHHAYLIIAQPPERIAQVLEDLVLCGRLR